MSNLTKIASSTQVSKLVREFDAIDNKGRRFGARVIINQVVYVPQDADARWGYYRPAGTYFVADPRARRGGASYGASQRDQVFVTQAEAEAWAAAYFIRAEKGALKNKARAA